MSFIIIQVTYPNIDQANKTISHLLQKEKIHSYKIPCITKFDVEANKIYEEWIRKETK